MEILPWNGENLPEHLRACDLDADLFYGKFRRLEWGVDYMAWQAVDEDGKCRGVGGAIKEWRGVATAFMALSDEIFKHPLWLHRQAKQKMIEVVDEMELHRLQALVEVGFPKHYEWAERLGFKPEGILRQYCYNRKDWVIFSWLS